MNPGFFRMLMGLICFQMGIFPFETIAQTGVRFQHLGIEDGLSQSSVFAIAQDGDGYMWFGTRNGLNRYDGYRFVPYHQGPDRSHGLIANDIRNLYYDRETQSLWIGTNEGLSQYLLHEDRFQNFRIDSTGNDLISDYIFGVFRDREKRLWVGTNHGLYVWDMASLSFQRGPDCLASGPLAQDVSVGAFAQDHSGQLWVGTSVGLYQLVRTENQEVCLEPALVAHPELRALKDLRITSLSTDSLGNIWLGTHEAGVYYWNRKTTTLTGYQQLEGDPSSLSHNRVRTVRIDQKGRVWIGTFKGLNLYLPHKDAFQSFYCDEVNPNDLSNCSIHSLFEDHDGGLWIGSYYNGISYLDDRYNRFTLIEREPSGQGLSANIVSSFCESPEGNLWIGTEGGGLNYWDREKQVVSRFEPRPSQSLSGNNIKTLLADQDRLWIGTFQGGLNLLYPREKRLVHYLHNPADSTSLSHNNVYGLFQEGTCLWIATYGGGLNCMDTRTGQFTHFPHRSQDAHSLSSNLARGVYKDQQDQIWVGTDQGLNLMKRDERGAVTFRTYLPEAHIYAFLAVDTHTIWIGTFNHGLYCLNPQTNSLRNYTMADGLPGNAIFGILADEAGNIWLSTNQGIAKFNPHLGTFATYQHTNGLEKLEFNFNAYYQTRAGEMLFGSTHGFTLFHPEEIKPDTSIPPLVFTGLETANQWVSVHGADGLLSQPLNQTEQIVFPYKEANFTLHFSSLDYSNSRNQHFAYKMEGVDPDWKMASGAPEATYTLQREGNYVFRLKNANGDGVWGKTERQIRVVVLPPLWRTGWAYAAYLLILGLVVLGIVRFTQLRHSYQLEQLSKRKQEELHQSKLRFFINITHEFRTPLTLILGPLQEMRQRNEGGGLFQKKLISIEQNAHRLLNMVNQLLDFRKLESGFLQMEVGKGNFVRFLEEIYLSFKEMARLREIRYSFEAEAEEMELWYDRDQLEKVFFNLLSNAFKFTPNEGEIKIQVFSRKDQLEIAVQNTGKGIASETQFRIFQRFVKGDTEPDPAHSPGSSGIGLAICEQLIELHGGKIWVDSEVDKGTTFWVSLPKGRDHFQPDDILENFRNSEDLSQYPFTKALREMDPVPPALGLTPPTAKVLLVEDNPEIRAYTASVLQADYQVMQAQNGTEGLEMAIAQQPDLIISDVMMPGLDGISLCSELKSRMETSHIPVILLTARTPMIFRIEGLETGADDFVTKPFHPQALKLKVRNLIQTRQKLREKFGRISHFDPKEISVTSTDERFLQKLMEVAEAQIENPGFTMEDFAEEMAVSRPLLFSKVKSLTNQTPNNFLKTIRLKRAAQLLTKGHLGIAEIAYMVGFRDPRYFSKCFQKEFGSTPTEYMKKRVET